MNATTPAASRLRLRSCTGLALWMTLALAGTATAHVSDATRAAWAKADAAYEAQH